MVSARRPTLRPKRSNQTSSIHAMQNYVHQHDTANAKIDEMKFKISNELKEIDKLKDQINIANYDLKDLKRHINEMYNEIDIRYNRIERFKKQLENTTNNRIKSNSKFEKAVFARHKNGRLTKREMNLIFRD